MNGALAPTPYLLARLYPVRLITVREGSIPGTCLLVYVLLYAFHTYLYDLFHRGPFYCFASEYSKDVFGRVNTLDAPW